MLDRFSVKALLASASIFSLCVSQAKGQSVDYGTLEQMFGEPITTSVTGSPQRASEAPAAMTIVSQDDIRRSGADNIPDVLQFVTGIDIKRYSFGEVDIAVRGYDQPMSPRLLVLVNGRQVYLDSFGYVDWNSIPVQLSEIRQIEVVKGPQSALFGFNAAGGVINIITYDPLLDGLETVTADGGTQGLAEGQAVGTVRLGKTFGARLSVGGFTANEFDHPNIASTPLNKNGRVNLDTRWQVAPKILLRAQGSLTDNHYLQFLPGQYFITEQNQTNDFEVGGAADTSAGLFDLDFYRNEARSARGLIDPTVDYDVVRVVKLTDLLKLNTRNTLRVALEFRNNLGASDQIYDGTLQYADYAGSLTLNSVITPRLSVVNSLRIDYAQLNSTAFSISGNPRSISQYNGQTITEPTFNSGVVFAATPIDTVRLTAARGLQMPSLFDFGLQLPAGTGVNLLGVPDLRPTAVWNLDLGYDRALASIGSELTVDGFLQRNTELIAAPGNGPIAFSSGGVVLASANIGSSNEAGLEIGLKGRFANGLRYNASYRFVAIGQDVSGDITPNDDSARATGTPRNDVILGVGYTIRPWEFDLNGRWQSAITDYLGNGNDSAPLVVGDYVTFAGRAGYDLTKNLTLSVSAQQFNLEKIRESAGLLVDRRVIAGATAHF